MHFIFYYIMALSGSKNTLIGYGAVLPSNSASNQIVIGTQNETVYFGGAGNSNGGGLFINSTALSLSGNTSLTVSGKSGSVGQYLVSNGPSAAPYWGPPNPRQFTSDFTVAQPISSLYVLENNANPSVLFKLPAPMASQAPIYVKNNTNTSALTVSGLNLIAQGTTNVTASGILGFGGSLQCMSDGYNWFVQQLVTGTFPVAPIAPTGVSITTPGSGTVTSLTVNWTAPANTTRYIVNTYLGGVLVGTATVASPATSLAVPATSGSYTIITTSNYTATVQAFNYYVIGGTGTSGDYNWSQPTAVSITTPASGASVNNLTVNWIRPSGLIDHYQVNIYQNGAIVGFNNNVSNAVTSISIAATNSPYLIESAFAISTTVIAYADSGSSNPGLTGTSPSYLWGVITNVTSNAPYYNGDPAYYYNPVVYWTPQAYSVGTVSYMINYKWYIYLEDPPPVDVTFGPFTNISQYTYITNISPGTGTFIYTVTATDSATTNSSVKSADPFSTNTA